MARSERELIYFQADAFDQALDAATDETIKIIQQAIRATVTRVRRHAVTWLSSEIRKEWNIKKKDLDKRISVRIGNRGVEYEAFEMTIKGTAISLSYFGARQFSGARVQTRSKGYVRSRASRFQGVQVEVKKGRKTKLPNAFMQAAPSGHVMVLRRTGKGRYPIDMKAVISPASMFEQDDLYDRFTDAVMDRLEREFEGQLRWRLDRAGLL
jgi:hypothetical protein